VTKNAFPHHFMTLFVVD